MNVEAQPRFIALVAGAGFLVEACAPAHGAALQQGDASPTAGKLPAAHGGALLTDTAPEVVLRFADDSSLRGVLRDLHPDRGVRLLRSDSPEVLPFSFDQLRQIRFLAKTNAPAAPPASCRATLANGDELAGELLELDHGRLLLQTRFLGRLEIPRGLVRQLAFPDRYRELLYGGPFGEDGWIISGDDEGGTERTTLRPETLRSWTLGDGRFATRTVGTLGRDCKLTPLCRVAFDVEWTGTPRLRLIFYARDVDKYTYSEGYHFFCSGKGSIHGMTRMTDPALPAGNLTAHVPALEKSDRVHLEFRLNSQKGTTQLFADGEFVHEWTHLGYPGAGTGIVFYNYRPQTRLSVGNIRVSEWDGRPLPRQHTETGLALVRFGNRDHVNAEVENMDTNRLNLSMSGRKMEIPVERVAEIHLDGGPAIANNQPAGTRVIRLTGGSRLQSDRVELALDQLTLQHRLLGALHLPASEVSSLEFASTPRIVPAEKGTAP